MILAALLPIHRTGGGCTRTVRFARHASRKRLRWSLPDLLMGGVARTDPWHTHSAWDFIESPLEPSSSGVVAIRGQREGGEGL